MITQVISTLRKLYLELKSVIDEVQRDKAVPYMFTDVTLSYKSIEELHQHIEC